MPNVDQLGPSLPNVGLNSPTSTKYGSRSTECIPVWANEFNELVSTSNPAGQKVAKFATRSADVLRLRPKMTRIRPALGELDGFSAPCSRHFGRTMTAERLFFRCDGSPSSCTYWDFARTSACATMAQDKCNMKIPNESLRSPPLENVWGTFHGSMGQSRPRC